jgi:hypothetical protein
LAKGTEILAYKVILLTAENRTFRKANEGLSKRRKAKKNTRTCQEGVLTIEHARDVLAQKNAEE